MWGSKLAFLLLGAFIGAGTAWYLATAQAQPPARRWIEPEDGVQPRESLAEIAARYH